MTLIKSCLCLHPPRPWAQLGCRLAMGTQYPVCGVWERWDRQLLQSSTPLTGQSSSPVTMSPTDRPLGPSAAEPCSIHTHIKMSKGHKSMVSWFESCRFAMLGKFGWGQGLRNTLSLANCCQRVLEQLTTPKYFINRLWLCELQSACMCKGRRCKCTFMPAKHSPDQG